MTSKDILYDIIHHEHGIIFEINQIEECLLVFKSMDKDKNKLNFNEISSFFAFLQKLLIEKILLSLSKIYDQYDINKEEIRIRSIKHLNKFLKTNSDLNRHISTFSYNKGKDNAKFFKNLKIEEINSAKKLSSLISKTNPLNNEELRDRFTTLRNKYLVHNEQGYTVNNNDSIDWTEFDELIYFAKDCINTISCLYLNKSCFYNDKFIQMYSIEETEYCFKELKKYILIDKCDS